jgi:uncharacterized protein (DUF362 family)
MTQLTRRDVLRGSLSLGGLSGAVRFLTGCGVPAAPELLAGPSEAAAGATARVAAIRGKDLVQMTRDALDALGGIGTVVHSGESVFLKPNYSGIGISGYDIVAVGEATKPEIVVAVAEAALEAGAREVVIGEGAQTPHFDWGQILTLNRETNLAAEAARLNAKYGERVKLACLEGDSPGWDMVSSPYSGLGEIAVSSLVTQADRIISLPVLKTHRYTQITAALKNFVGTASLQRYGIGLPWRFGLHYCPGGIESTFLDVVAGVQPDLTLIDVSVCCEGNGPNVLPGWWGNTLDMRDRRGDWVMLASTDLVAADATAARIMGQNPADVRHLAQAYQRGLGQTQADKIALLGARLEELQVEWKPAVPAGNVLESLPASLAWMLHL